MTNTMSSGANNQAGINFQNLAGLSLFLQYCGNDSFRGIALEQPGQADFVLEFEKNRIICEVKKHKVTYRDLRDILGTLKNVNSQDRILIICTDANEGFLSKVKSLQSILDIDQQIFLMRLRQPLDKKFVNNVNKWKGEYLKLLGFFQNKGFGEQHFELIPQVEFLVVGENDNETIVKGLLSKAFGAWLPTDELDDLAYSLSIRSIYHKSAKSGLYSKEDFNKELKARREALIGKDDYKARQRSAREKADVLLKELQDPSSRIQAENRLKAVSADPPLFYLAITELEKHDDLNIRDWSSLWAAAFGSYFPNDVMRIFKEKIQDQESADYVIGFLQNNIDNLLFRAVETYALVSTADTLLKSLKFSPQSGEKVFGLLKILHSYLVGSPLFFGCEAINNDKWFLEEEIINSFCFLYRNAEQPLKKNIIGYIYDNFDIVNLVGSPRPCPLKMYGILEEHIKESPQNFRGFLDAVKKNYITNYKKYNFNSDGWDASGRGIDQNSQDYELEDKEFITKILVPYIRHLGREEQWRLADEFLVTDARKVSWDKPDFMNRAFIPFLLEQYASASDEESQKAFRYLAAFIKMRRGIPFKTDLIFFYAKEIKELSGEKKWRLLEVALKEYEEDVINIFMDQMLWELLELGHPQATETLLELITKENYLKKVALSWRRDVSYLWEKIIKNDVTFDVGVNYLEKLLGGDDSFNSLDPFRAGEFEEPVTQIIIKDFNRGLTLLKTLVKSDEPSENQQLVFGAVLGKIPEEYAGQIFNELLKPALDKAKTAAKFAERFTEISVRGNFVFFAGRLAKAKKFEEALYIAQFFVDDPSPMQRVDEDSHGRDARLFSAKGVRDAIGPGLLSFMSVDGQPYLNQVFEITQKLCRDKNSDVRRSGMLVLCGLMRNRNTVMPDSKERFMREELAQKIEGLAFELLGDDSNHRPKTMVWLGYVFNSMRTIDTDQALKVIDLFFRYPVYEALSSIAQLIIFLAEFRKDAFKDKEKMLGATAMPYDPEPIQDLLKDILKQGPSEVRRALVSELVSLPRASDDPNFDRFFGIIVKYLPHVLEKYDPEVFGLLPYFCDKYMERKFDECHRLWRRCLIAEREGMIAIINNGAPVRLRYALCNIYNEKILLKVLERRGEEQFLEDVDFLVNYPKEINFANDVYFFKGILERLERINGYTEKVESIYQRIIEINYLYYPEYEKWRSKKPSY